MPDGADQLMEEALWEKYRFLTMEMRRFLALNDADAFLELLRQRDFFEEKILKGTEHSYIKSQEGQELLKKLCETNREIVLSVRKWLNTTRNSRNVGRAYESLGLGSSTGWNRSY